MKNFASNIRDYGKFYSILLVSVTELTKRDDLLRHVDHWRVVDARDFHSSYEGTVRSWHLFVNLTSIFAWRAAHARATTLNVADAIPFKAPFSNFI